MMDAYAEHPLGSVQPRPRTTASTKAEPADEDDGLEIPAPHRCGGRQVGASNYTDADVRELLRLIRNHLPVGPKGWEIVCSAFNVYASRCNRPKRDVLSLRSKFNRVGRSVYR